MTRLNGRGLHIKTKRMDPRARELRYEVFFPHDVDPPFLVSHVSTGPGPQDFTHPKGTGSMTRVAYPLPVHERDTVRGLNDDQRLELVKPGQAIKVTFDDDGVLCKPL
jgi:hypothetical protein avisC_09985